jgi:NAD(P)-dependent dehydrogenase (short-subunit alcohol dehydrogenase family)
MKIDLNQRVAIVTGAGHGRGATIARTLATAGARVAVNDLNPDRAEKVAAEIRAAGGQAIGIAADVSNKFQCVHLIETTRAEFGQLDILVNNAEVRPASTILKQDEWEWNRCLEVNLKGAFFMSQLTGRVMADENQDRGGAIVNISSPAGFATPLENRAAFCASKAGMVGFARECAREFAAYGIRVNTILPAADQEDDAHQAVAHLALFLCSAAAGQTTGGIFPINAFSSNTDPAAVAEPGAR